MIEWLNNDYIYTVLTLLRDKVKGYDNSQEIKLSQKVKKSSKEFKEKKKLNEIKQKKNLKSKKKFCELSEEFFSEKITEVSL